MGATLGAEYQTSDQPSAKRGQTGEYAAQPQGAKYLRERRAAPSRGSGFAPRPSRRAHLLASTPDNCRDTDATTAGYGEFAQVMAAVVTLAFELGASN
jgi:hypothetical protein